MTRTYIWNETDK